MERQKHDFDKIITLISSLDSQIRPNAASDHLHLGKYGPNSYCPRQIQVRFTRTFEVSCILSKFGNIQVPLSIKPD